MSEVRLSVEQKYYSVSYLVAKCCDIVNEQCHRMWVLLFLN